MENRYTFKFTLKEMMIIRSALKREEKRRAKYPDSDKTQTLKVLAFIFNRRITDLLKIKPSRRA